MDLHAFILLLTLCFITLSSCSYKFVHTKFIHKSVKLGQFISIGEKVSIKANSIVGNFVGIAPFTSVGEKTRIGGATNIGKYCSIGDHVNIQKYAQIGDRVKLGDWVRVDVYSNVANNVTIADDCILDEHSAIGPNVQIQTKAYVGRYSIVQSNAVVGKSALIQQHVLIESGATVKDNEIVIQTPSTLELYINSSPFIASDIAEFVIPFDGTISSTFNEHLRGMIDEAIDVQNSDCTKTNKATKPKKLSTILSVYLIHYHGHQRFTENIQLMMHELSSFANSINSNKMEILSKEHHFGVDAKVKLLEPDVEQKLIWLLTLQQDAERTDRASDDTYCSVIKQIQSGERKITFGKRIV